MTTLERELQQSFFLRMKLPEDRLDRFIKRIISLPEKQRSKSVAIIMEAERKSQAFMEKQNENAQEFLKEIPNFTDKTKQKYKTKKATLEGAKTSFKDLKSKIKK